VRLGEVERFDPEFYLELSLNDDLKSLNNIVEFSKEKWNQKDYFEEKFPYIEISEINLETGEINNISWINKKEAPSRAKMIVRDGDIIVSTTRPDRGAITKISKKHDGFIASTGFAVIRKYKNVNSDYLFYLLRSDYCLKQMGNKTSGGNYPAITLEDLKSLQIPLPPIPTQQKLVEMMDEAYSLKKQKEQKANELLDSIDDFVMGELGINIEKFKVKSEKIEIFGVRASELKRFDVDYVLQKKALSNSKYPSLKLAELCEMYQPKTITKNEMSEDEKYPVFGANGLIGRYKDFNHKEYEVLLGCRGSCGEINISEPFSWITGNAMVVKPKNETQLTKVFLSIVLGSLNLETVITGSVQPQITRTDLQDFEIPLPPLEIQQKISQEVEKRRSQAFELQLEAKEILEKAKQEFELEILE
jgi:type I restriction enzyme S subunit